MDTPVVKARIPASITTAWSERPRMSSTGTIPGSMSSGGFSHTGPGSSSSSASNASGVREEVTHDAILTHSVGPLKRPSAKRLLAHSGGIEVAPAHDAFSVRVSGSLMPGAILVSMSTSLEEWWPQLRQETRDWLVANNGDEVPAAVAKEITQAGGSVTPDDWWVGHVGTDSFHLSDKAVDWIEAVANDEVPEPPSDS
jgi:hypothetical protein